MNPPGIKSLFSFCRQCLWLGFFIFPSAGRGQKFNFLNYNVQQGLVQSQVSGICQDASDNLWISTWGGISRFDGRSFSNFTETDGLANNFTNCIMASRSGFIWVGTRDGLSRFDGSRFVNYRFTRWPSGNYVQSIAEDRSGVIWVRATNMIYTIDSWQRVLPVNVTSIYDTVTALAADPQGTLWAAVFHKGIYRLEGQRWLLAIPLNPMHRNDHFLKIIFDRENRDRIFLLGKARLVSAEHGRIMESPSVLPYPKNDFYVDLFQDKSNKLWLLTRQALFQCVDFHPVLYSIGNGYTNNSTMAVFQDRENNIWFGTNGSGLMRYAGQPFIIYDQFNTSKNAVIMYLLEGNDHRLYIGTDGSGVFVYDGDSMIPVRIPSEMALDKRIICLSKGSNNEIYILTANSTLWKYADNRVTPVRLPILDYCTNAVLADEKGGFYVAGCHGCFYYSSSGKTIRVLTAYCNNLLHIDRDSILVSALNGLYLVKDSQTFRKINFPGVDSCAFMSIKTLNKFYLLATGNRGFILYNTITHATTRFTTKNGLNSDFVYSVVHDNGKQIWLGTGRGMNKLVLDTANGTAEISDISTPGDISSSECNQNAAAYDYRQNLWFGTGSGLMEFFPVLGKKDLYLPPITLQKLELFSQKIPAGKFSDSSSPEYQIPYHLSLPHDQNHLSFSYGCASFLNADKIVYQYRLEGMDKDFSAFTTNRAVTYSGLPPGRYTFRARAFLPGYGYSRNSIRYPFVISAAFYQTTLFRLLIILFGLCLVLWIQWLRMNHRIKRLKQIEAIK
ncbi:MAG TPA: two-component regulator propeller domain-containing protein, partial [Puia sp.]